MTVEMELSRILIRENDDMHVVELREKDGERVFPIVIGINEAFAIERRLMNHTPPRPQTHELLSNIIDAVGFRIERVIISDLKQHTFYARLILSDGEQEIDVDARPSDAIALGVATDVRIFVAEAVLNEVCKPSE